LGRFKFFKKFSEIFAAQCTPPVIAGVVDTGGKFATDVVDTGIRLDTSVIKFATGVIDTGGAP
jgi:hypothetical protein